jgi:Tfp pilus assembly protein PilF
VMGSDDRVTLTSMNNLATIYLDRGAWKEAESLLTEALATNRRVRGAEHPLTLSNMDRLAQVFGQQGRYREAEAIRREVFAIRLRTLGPEHAGTSSARGNLAQNLVNQGDPAKLPEAERLFTENLGISRRVNGERNRLTNSIRVSLGDLYEEQRRYADAEAMLRDAVSGMRESPGPQHPSTLNAFESLGLVCLKQRKFTDAEHVLRDALAGREKAMPKSWHRFEAESLLGASLAGQRRFAEAERLIVSGYEGMRQQVASIPAYNRESLTAAGQRVVDLYAGWGKPAQAAEWRKNLLLFLVPIR